MTLRIDDPVRVGSFSVEMICEVSCDGGYSWGGFRFYGAKRPIALIIDDGIHKTVWKLSGPLTSDALAARLQAYLCEGRC